MFWVDDMKAGKYLLMSCILGGLLYMAFAHLSSTEQVEPIRPVITSKRAQDFQQTIEKYFGANGRLLMPLGFYAVTSHIRKTYEMKHLIQNGITFIHKYDSYLTLAKALRDVDSAVKAGAPLALNLPNAYLYNDRQWWEAYLGALVNKKQIVMWYLPEEPASEDIPQLRRLAGFVREVDKSGRPILTYLKDTNRYILTESSKFLDCVVFGAYPGVSPQIPRIRVAYKIDIAYAYGAPAVITALESYKPKSGWTEPEHVKFDAYLALIHGARGLWWYCYAQIRDNPELLDAVLAVARLLNGPEYLGEVFLKGEDNQDIQARIVAGPTVFTEGFNASMKLRMAGNPSIHWRAYSHRGHIYLAMVNCCQVMNKPYSQEDEKALTVKVEFQGLGNVSKIVLLDGESVYSHQSGLLTVTLKPLAVAVFKITP
jgi:hypothetical protein